MEVCAQRQLRDQQQCPASHRVTVCLGGRQVSPDFCPFFTFQMLEEGRPRPRAQGSKQLAFGVLGRVGSVVRQEVALSGHGMQSPAWHRSPGHEELVV